jgi:hypothetical protein
MLGFPALLIGFDENTATPQHRDIYNFQSQPLDPGKERAAAIITPDLQKLPDRQKEFYLSKIRDYLKPEGFCIERSLTSVKTIKKSEIPGQ